MELTLAEIREVIEEHRPVDRPEEHRGPYYFEEGQRNMCDKLLAFFADVEEDDAVG